MSNIILFVSVKTLKEQYIFDDNIEDRYLIPNIKKGMDFLIHPLLGDDKYEEMVAQVDSNTVTPENEIILKQYIQPILAYYVLSEVIYTTAYKIKNNPVSEDSPNEGRFDELVKLSNKYRRDSEQYQQRLKYYLCDNNIVLDTEGMKNTFKTGFYLG